jgi:RNA polymerase sigma-70 factor (family 1)
MSLQNQNDVGFNDENQDDSFFKAIYLDFYPGLIVFANGYLKDNALAEDTVEDVFIKLWKNKNTISAIKNLKLYLYISVKNSCINHLVKLKKINIKSIDELKIDFESITASAEESIISKESIKFINAEINKLPNKCKAIFILVKEEELKYSEVATLLNLSVKTVEAQMSIAFKKLAAALKIEFQVSFFKTERRKSI